MCLLFILSSWSLKLVVTIFYKSDELKFVSWVQRLDANMIVWMTTSKYLQSKPNQAPKISWKGSRRTSSEGTVVAQTRLEIYAFPDCFAKRLLHPPLSNQGSWQLACLLLGEWVLELGLMGFTALENQPRWLRVSVALVIGWYRYVLSPWVN